MKRKAIIIFLLLSYIAASSYAQQSKVDVTYVGNAGFLINIGDKKILIDALFKGFEGNYQVPLEVQDKLAKAQAPFDDVDLILVTHAHGDHINLEMVRQHMQGNPGAVFASTQQLVDALNDSTDRWIGFNPTKEKSDSKVISDISVEAFSLPHGPDESYLLFSSNRHDPENDAGDIYISYHSSDGSWSEPVNIGAPVNTNYQERFPVISPDGRFLFFTRPTPGHDQDVYWVSAELIKDIGKNH